MKKVKESKLSKSKADTSSKYWRKKADKEWRRLAMKKANGKCEVCGKDYYLNVHHLVPRELHKYRCDSNNAIVLCCTCHKYGIAFSAHRNSLRFAYWLMNNKKEQWEFLVDVFNDFPEDNVVPDYKAIYEQFIMGKSV